MLSSPECGVSVAHRAAEIKLEERLGLRPAHCGGRGGQAAGLPLIVPESEEGRS